MMAANGVTYPKSWDRLARDLRFPAVVFPIASLMAIAFGVSRGEGILAWAGMSTFIGASSIFLALYWWRLFSTRESRLKSVSTEASVFVVREEWVVKCLFCIAVAAGILMATILSAYSQFFLAENSPGDRRLHMFASIAVFVAPVLLAFLVLSGVVYILGRAAVRGGRLGVGMDSKGIYHWWWAGCSFFPWEEISGIQLMPPAVGPVVRVAVGRYDYPGDPAETRIGRMVPVRRWHRRLNLGFLRTHPGLVYQALVFYWRNPELRGELEDERAVDRMKRRDYGKIPLEIETHGRALSPSEAALE